MLRCGFLLSCLICRRQGASVPRFARRRAVRCSPGERAEEIGYKDWSLMLEMSARRNADRRLLEVSMRMLAMAFCALGVGINFSSGVQGPATNTERARFHVEVHATGEKGPSFTVTNRTGRSVTACVFQLSYPSPGRRNSNIAWDELIQGGPVIEPGATILRPFFLFAGSPIPDKVEIIAGVWADGGTFGEPESTNNILKNRAMRASEYEQTATLLQQGLDQNWAREQYQQAFRDKADSGSVYTVRTALSATQQTAPTQQEFNRVMQTLVQSFKQYAERLRKGKPAPQPVAPK